MHRVWIFVPSLSLASLRSWPAFVDFLLFPAGHPLSATLLPSRGVAYAAHRVGRGTGCGVRRLQTDRDDENETRRQRGGSAKCKERAERTCLTPLEPPQHFETDGRASSGQGYALPCPAQTSPNKTQRREAQGCQDVVRRLCQGTPRAVQAADALKNRVKS